MRVVLLTAYENSSLDDTCAPSCSVSGGNSGSSSPWPACAASVTRSELSVLELLERLAENLTRSPRENCAATRGGMKMRGPEEGNSSSRMKP